MFGKGKDAAKALYEGTHVLENIRALQIAQKEIAQSVADLRTDFVRLSSSLQVIQAEIRREVQADTTAQVLSVLGGLNQRIEDLNVRVSRGVSVINPGRFDNGEMPDVNDILKIAQNNKRTKKVRDRTV